MRTVLLNHSCSHKIRRLRSSQSSQSPLVFVWSNSSSPAAAAASASASASSAGSSTLEYVDNSLYFDELSILEYSKTEFFSQSVWSIGSKCTTQSPMLCFSKKHTFNCYCNCFAKAHLDPGETKNWTLPVCTSFRLSMSCLILQINSFFPFDIIIIMKLPSNLRHFQVKIYTAV